MTSIERTAYPRFAHTSTAAELNEHYTPSQDDLRFAQRTTRRIEQRFQLLIQLKTFQRLGYFLPLDQAPSAIIEHLRTCLHLAASEPVGYAEPRTLYRHQHAIRVHLRITADGKMTRQVATQAIFHAAQTMDTPADLINVALEALVAQRCELPAFSTLDRLTQHIRAVVNRGLFARILARLTPDDQRRLDTLLERGVNPSRAPFAHPSPQRRSRRRREKTVRLRRAESVPPTEGDLDAGAAGAAGNNLTADAPYGAVYSSFQRLKEPPQNASVSQLREQQEVLAWLEGVCSPSVLQSALVGIPHVKIAHFAAEARALDSDALRDMTTPKRLTLLVCLLAQTQVKVRDQLVEIFLKRIGSLHRVGKETLDALRQRQQATVEQLLAVLTDVVRLVSDVETAPLTRTVAPRDASNQMEAPPRDSGAPSDERHEAHETHETQTAQQRPWGEDGAASGAPQDNDDTDDATLGRGVRDRLSAEGGARAVLERCEELAAHNRNNYLPLLKKPYERHRRPLFRLAHILNIQSATQDRAVADALAFVLTLESRRGEDLPAVPATLDLSFATAQWRRTLAKPPPRAASSSRHTGGIDGIDGTSASAKTRTEVARTAVAADTRLDRVLLEICAFSYVAAELKTGDLFVVNSHEYADYRAQLLPWEVCAPLVPAYCREVGIPETASAFVADLTNRLRQTASAVDTAFLADGVLQIGADGAVHLKEGVPPPPRPEVARLEQHLAEQIPERTQLGALCNTAHRVGWPRHFGPLSGSDPKLDHAHERYILTVFAYATNLGPNQLARHSRGRVTAHQLSMVHLRHISAQGLDRANHELRLAFAECALPAFWGTGRVAIADGTKYDVPERSLLAERSIRYGGVGGIAYHHITDQYVALFSRFIACGAWEAIYILDVLLQRYTKPRPHAAPAHVAPQNTPQNTPPKDTIHSRIPHAAQTTHAPDVSDLEPMERQGADERVTFLAELGVIEERVERRTRPGGPFDAFPELGRLENGEREEEPIETLHADTQGQSTPVFALAHLLGVQLMPRIRNWNDLVFYRPDKETHYTHIETLFGAAIDWNLIETHWQDMLRVALSLQAGTILPSTLLRKLSNYSRKNKLYQAFREVGRVVRTVFLLRYISDPVMRRDITAHTNKLESYNHFTDFLSFGDEDRLIEKTPEEADKRMKYLNLLANAVMLQNVADLGDALRALGRQGIFVEAESVAALSPYGTAHLKRFGDYTVDLRVVPKALDPSLPANVRPHGRRSLDNQRTNEDPGEGATLADDSNHVLY